MRLIEINIMLNFQTIYLKYVYFTDQNTLNFWSFFPFQRVYLVIGSYLFDEITWNSVQMCRRIVWSKLWRKFFSYLQTCILQTGKF